MYLYWIISEDLSVAMNDSRHLFVVDCEGTQHYAGDVFCYVALFIQV